jgi:hypothetical protein
MSEGLPNMKCFKKKLKKQKKLKKLKIEFFLSQWWFFEVSAHSQYPWVKFGAHKGLGHQVLALMLVVVGTSFLLLNALKLSRPKKYSVSSIEEGWRQDCHADERGRGWGQWPLGRPWLRRPVASLKSYHAGKLAASARMRVPVRTDTFIRPHGQRTSVG